MSRDKGQVHYANVEYGNESQPEDEWGETACGLELEPHSLTDREDRVTCKNCLRTIKKNIVTNLK